MRILFNSGPVKKLICSAGLALLIFVAACSSPEPAKLTQKALPYAEDALEPYISAATMKLHYGKHHAGYIAKTNALLEKSSLRGKPLDKIVKESFKDRDENPELFNNAAQAWNHEFFWTCLKPNGGGKPGPILEKKIQETYRTVDAFEAIFFQAAAEIFGSGWVWLAEDEDGLLIVITSNADTPLAHNMKPLLTIDVWEHSYYLDYRNKRAEYVKALFENLVDWDAVEARLAAED